MKTAFRTIAFGGVVTILSIGTAALLTAEAAPAPKTAKVATMSCPNGWRGSAGGTYGGVSFSLGCDFDRQSVVIDGTDGTAYSMRMGVENFNGGYDCFFSGDASNVRETCVEVKISIR